MEKSGKKPQTQHDASCDGPRVNRDVPRTLATRNNVVHSAISNMSLRGLVCLFALLCSLFMVTSKNRPVPFGEPPSDAVDHVNP